MTLMHRLSAAATSGTAFLSAAAFLFSFVALGVKLIDDAVPATELTFLSSSASLVLTSLILRLPPSAGGSGRAAQPLVAHTRLPPRQLRLLLLRGALGALAVLCFYASVELLPLQDAVSLFFANPAFCVLLERVVLRRAASRQALFGCALTIGGVFLIGRQQCALARLLPCLPQPTGNGGGVLAGLTGCTGAGVDAPHSAGPAPAATSALMRQPSGRMMAGVALALVGSFANAASFVCVTALGPEVSSLLITWVYHLLVALLSAAAALLPTALSGGAFVALSQRDWLLLGGVTIANFAGQLLLNLGFQREPPVRGAALNTAQVLYSFLWGVLLLGERPNVCALVGSGCIMLGVLAVAAGRSDGSGDGKAGSAASAVGGLDGSSGGQPVVVVAATEGLTAPLLPLASCECDAA